MYTSAVNGENQRHERKRLPTFEKIDRSLWTPVFDDQSHSEPADAELTYLSSLGIMPSD